MPYEASIDVVNVLRSTLYLLENARYPEEDSPSIASLRANLHLAIAELEALAKRSPQSDSPQPEKADQAASRRA